MLGNKTDTDTCRICGNASGNEEHLAREMMFGLRTEFAYFLCSRCQCLQIREFPEDMAQYYPANYYSMEAPLAKGRGWLRDSLRRLDARIRLRACNYGRTKRQEIFAWFKNSGAGFDAKILDVGCGRGGLLHQLRLDGFRNLTGVDPFIQSELQYANGIRIHKCEIAELRGGFDLIMLHHSFEHMRDPRNALNALGKLLNPGGTVLIRIPVMPSAAWREYGTDWFQLDAPRHFFLHSRTSMDLLAQGAGFRVDRMVFDSKAAQFWASEQYRRDIPLRSERSYSENAGRSVFSREEIRAYAARARAANRAGEGDSACFYLRRAPATKG